MSHSNEHNEMKTSLMKSVLDKLSDDAYMRPMIAGKGYHVKMK